MWLWWRLRATPHYWEVYSDTGLHVFLYCFSGDCVIIIPHRYIISKIRYPGMQESWLISFLFIQYFDHLLLIKFSLCTINIKAYLMIKSWCGLSNVENNGKKMFVYAVSKICYHVLILPILYIHSFKWIYSV